jgi:hypothetical protein
MSSPTLIIGDGNWAVKSGSLLGYEYGELSGQFAPIPITGLRASSATYTNRAGTIVSASNDILRVDYTYTTSGSLLIEPQRTNNVLFSEDLTNANWVKTNVTASSNSIVSPNGTQDADTLTATATTGQHQVQNGSHASGSIMASIFAQKGTISSFQIFSGVNSQAFTNFNLDTGTVGTSGSLTLGSIQNIGNGWYRCNTFITASAGSTIRWALVSSDSASYGESWTTSGTESIYLWGGQVEVGAYPTTYIPTTTASATRVADACSKTGISDLIGQTEGTLFVEVNVTNWETPNRVLAISDGTSNNRVVIIIGTPQRFRVLATVGGAAQVDMSSLSLTNGIHKVAIAYKQNDFAFYVDGVQAGTDTSALVPTCTDVYVGKIEQASAAQFLGNGINQAAIFTTRLSNAELVQLTTL